MQAVFGMFDERIKEINLYFDAIKELDNIKVNDVSKNKYFNKEFIKILKANTLIMIYNLVESTVMGSIQEVYDKLKSEDITYAIARKEIKDIWFSYKFNQVYDQLAHFNSYKEKALEIVNSILLGETIELDKKATSISGNIDAQKIRNLCSEHGITFKVDKSCHGGMVLETVKNKRNELAHGTLSFAECGRDYTIGELESIKSETITFLSGFLNGIKKYYDEKGYKIRD